MYVGILHLHSNLPFFLLLALIVSSTVFFRKKALNKPFSKGDKSLALITLILAHLQLALGLILYAISPVIEMAYANSDQIMSNSTFRFYAVEHGLVMLISIALITICYSRAKRKTESQQKFQTLGVFYLLGLLLALTRIPWDSWLVG